MMNTTLNNLIKGNAHVLLNQKTASLDGTPALNVAIYGVMSDDQKTFDYIKVNGILFCKGHSDSEYYPYSVEIRISTESSQKLEELLHQDFLNFFSDLDLSSEEEEMLEAMKKHSELPTEIEFEEIDLLTDEHNFCHAAVMLYNNILCALNEIFAVNAK
jgi:hypothetical protein